MKKGLLTIMGLILTLGLHGQVAIGQFRSHIPLHRFHSVAVDDQYAYAATHSGIMMLEKSTLNDQKPDITSWSKVDGLSDVDIALIAYDKLSKTLIISYDNGNLDLVRDDKLYNVNDIKNKQLTGSKKPIHIRIYDNHAYLVFNFGIVIVNLDNLLIEDSWFLKSNDTLLTARDMAVSDSRYYISTNRGIYSISRSNNIPSNFLAWQRENTEDADFDHIICFAGSLYANRNADEGGKDTIYVCSQNEWMPTTRAYDNVVSITANDQEIAICNMYYVDVFDASFNHAFKATWYQDDNSYPFAKEAVLDGDMVWVADDGYGLIAANRTFFYTKMFTANGPFATSVKGMCSHDGILATVPGLARSGSFTPAYQYPSLSWFSHNRWQYNSSEFYHYDPAHLTTDLINVIINPNNESEWYVASWGNGLFKCENQRVTEHYNAQNSIMDSTAEGKTFVSGLAFDKKGNLWFTNSQALKMLKMIEPDGTWHDYNITYGMITTPVGVVAEHLLVDSRGYKWVTFPRDDNTNTYHLIVFNDNGTYDNPGDDQFMRIDMNRAARVNSSTVYCIAEDLDGEIWIGTDKGVKVIYYPSKVFDGTALPNNILLEQDGYVSVLFEYEEITAIAVDGANRKWIGTNKAGVFLMSENGQEQLLHFTAEDHPLFSNQINSITIDHLTGEVFFGTTKGLVSYRGTATKGAEAYEDLLVYPNPVRHDYDGMVAVKGLKNNSLCKITDASGKLVWQGYSDGGQLVWNCKDHFGNRPATGVYFVMTSDEDGKEKIVTKFLFIH